jgi:hypothetical protein
MHLEGPWLSTTGKRRGKFKWASAEQKKQHEQLQADWQALKKKTMIKPIITRTLIGPFINSLNTGIPKLVPPPGRETPRIPSLDSGVGNATKKNVPVYTGNKMLGITILHKSCLQPVFNEQAAVDAAHMRR